MAWAARPDPAYSGQWVVLEGSCVVASGADGKAVYEEALGKGVRGFCRFSASSTETFPSSTSPSTRMAPSLPSLPFLTRNSPRPDSK